MKIIRSDTDEVRSTTNALRTSRTCDNFEAVLRELFAGVAMPQAARLPTYDTETRWSSTFDSFN